MNSKTLSYVGKTSQLHSYAGINLIIDLVSNKIKEEIPQFERLGRSTDLLLYVCEQIENLCYENSIKGQKGYKLEIAHKIFEKLGFNKVDDNDFVKNTISYLHSKGDIKQVKFSKRIVGFLKGLFVSKLIG